LQYIHELSRDPLHISRALRAAELPLSLASEAEGWESTTAVLQEIRKALDKVEAGALYVATKLKEMADKGSLKAVIEIAKLRGYYAPPPRTAKQLPPVRAGEQERRERIIDLLGLRAYPVPSEETGGIAEGDEGTDGEREVDAGIPGLAGEEN
jgi:hypothetical protein